MQKIDNRDYTINNILERNLEEVITQRLKDSWTPERRRKLRERRTGSSHSDKTKAKISIANKGRIYSELERQKWKNGWTSDVKAKFAESASRRHIRKVDTIPERLVESLLAVNSIQYTKQKVIILEEGYCIIDFFLDPNICIRVDGCYWHGCNRCCDILTITNSRITDVIVRDELINKRLQNLGYNIIRIWEHEVYLDLISYLQIIRSTQHDMV